MDFVTIIVYVVVGVLFVGGILITIGMCKAASRKDEKLNG